MGERGYSASNFSRCLEKLEEVIPFHSYIKYFEDYRKIYILHPQKSWRAGV